MSILTEAFSAKQICAGADIPMETLQNWMKWKLIVGQSTGNGPDESPGKGHRRSYTYFNLMEIAIAAALTRHGMALKHAFAVAIEFAHTDSNYPVEGELAQRLPGLPFKYVFGRTYLLVSEGVGEIVADRILASQAPHRGRKPFTVLDCTALFKDVMERLARSDIEAMSGAYTRNDL